MNLFDLCVYKNLNKGSGGDVDVSSLVATENKTYNAGEGKAYNPVVVNVPTPPPSLQSLTASHNGYFVPSSGYDGFDEVTVEVATPLETLNATENGTYTPSSGYEGFSEVTVDVPLPNNAYLLESQKNDVVTIQHGAEFDMPKLIASIEPQQSGSGDPSPENIRPISGWDECNVSVVGKNLLDTSNAVNATNVVDSVESDGTIHFKDVTATWSNTHIGKIYVIKGQTYVISAINIQYGRFGFSTSPTIYPTNSTFPNITIQGDASPAWIIGRAPTTRYFVANFTGYIYIFYCSDANYDSYHTTFATQIQIEVGETATTYEPYNGQTYTINFVDGSNPLTVYGGTLDVLSGDLDDIRKGFTLDGTETISMGTSGGKTYFTASISSKIGGYSYNTSPTNKDLFTSSHFKGDNSINYGNFYITGGGGTIVFLVEGITSESAMTTWLTNNTPQFVVPLATPQTYQLTPTEVKSLLGVNNIWADTGEVDVQIWTKEVTS